MGRSGAAHLRRSESALGFGGYVAFGELSAFAEEELLHLLFHDFLGAGIEGIEAVFVHYHFGVFDPEFPGVFRNIFEYALAELALPGRAVEAGQVAAEFDAVHHARAGLDRLVRGRCGRAGIVGH
jgi:hypothetical protein